MLRRGRVLYLGREDSREEILKYCEKEKEKFVIAASGKDCGLMLSLLAETEYFCAAAAVEPYFAPLYEYGRHIRYEKEKGNFRTFLQGLLDDDCFPAAEAVCPLLIIKEYEPQAFGTVQAEGLFHRMKSCYPDVPARLIFYHKEQEAAAKEKAEEWLSKAGGVYGETE